jgi:hypothetical protein
MMNVGAATSPFAALYNPFADAQLNATVVGGDIEVERVKFTAGPNLPVPNAAFKAMIKLEIPELLFWTENTIEFESNPEEENA